MMIILSYWIFLVSSALIIYIFGGQYERFFLFAILASTITTVVLHFHFGSLLSASHGLAFADIILLVIAGIFVLKSDRFWPIWFCGFHSITVTTDIAAIVFPSSAPGLYLNFAGLFALPALGCAAFGVYKDHKQLVPAG